MKILIAGKNSYIGCHIGQYVLEQDPAAQVDYISVRDDRWKEMDFRGYDSVIFAAAIVHRKDITDPEVYRKVNTVLPFLVIRVIASAVSSCILFTFFILSDTDGVFMVSLVASITAKADTIDKILSNSSASYEKLLIIYSPHSLTKVLYRHYSLPF